MTQWQNPITALIWISLGTLFVLGLIGFILLYVKHHLKKVNAAVKEQHKIKMAYQYELLENSIEIQEKERARIAGNIHDDLIAQLHRIKLINEDKILNVLLNDSIKTARLISHDLVPPLIHALSFEELIQDYIAPFKKTYKISLRCDVFNENEIEIGQKLHLFRIAQEIITNVLKHAKASSLSIHYRFSLEYVCLSISDNGIGFTGKEKSGAGLKNIESRNQMINGIYRMEINKSGGTTFLIIFRK